MSGKTISRCCSFKLKVATLRVTTASTVIASAVLNIIINANASVVAKKQFLNVVGNDK
jgi:hypothetical protein